jgi:hypothetical protein
MRPSPTPGSLGSFTNPPLVRCAILCLERALESMGMAEGAIIGLGVPSILLCILASKRVVLDRQRGRNRLGLGLGSPTDSAK